MVEGVFSRYRIFLPMNCVLSFLWISYGSSLLLVRVSRYPSFCDEEMSYPMVRSSLICFQTADRVIFSSRSTRSRRRTDPADRRTLGARLPTLSSSTPTISADLRLSALPPTSNRCGLTTNRRRARSRILSSAAKRYHARYAFGALQRAACLAGGSDWTVTQREPARGDRGRRAPHFPDVARRSRRRPDERLDLDTALAAFTIGAAWVNRLEGDTGTIEVGKLADLVVLDRDLRAIPDGAVADAHVLRTLVEGVEVYRA